MKKLIACVLAVVAVCVIVILILNQKRKTTTPEPKVPIIPAEPVPQKPTQPPKQVDPEPIPESNPDPKPVTDKTLFGEYLAAQKKGERAKLPDYSHAGYHRCEKPIPEITENTHRFIIVTRFGAVPNDGKSDRDAVLGALAAAHKHDGPAVVYFPEGNYRLFESTDFGKPPLEIKRSNIVIKGSGVGITQLEFSESPMFGKPLIHIRSSSGKDDYWRGDQKLKGKVLNQISLFAVEVSSTDGMQTGMRINLNPQMDVNKATTAEFYKPHTVPKGVLERAKNKGGKLTDIFELHEIKSIEGNTVTFAEPIHLELPFYENIAIYRIDHTVDECGIEDLSLRGGYRGQFKHHNGTRFGEDYRMIELDRAFNSWVRRVRFTEFSQAIQLWLCGFNTFSDILLEGNCGHTSITARSSYGNLFAFIREYSDTHHGLGVSRSGVNSVFLRCVQYKSMEAHCGYPRATLYDLNEGGFEPRGGGATFFPMHDKGLTFWNWNVTHPGSFDFWPEGNRYGYFLNPVVAGLHGEPFEIPDIETDLLAYESPGKPTSPESLFEAQLAHRLGACPEWLKESGKAFESISRHSGIQIAFPENHSAHNPKQAIPIKLTLRKGMKPDAIEKVILYASNSSLWDGFRKVGPVDSNTLETAFKPKDQGVWILKAKLTNTRGEISFSKPVTVLVGKPESLRQSKISNSTMIPGKPKNELYRDFVKQGGGEAARLWKSKVMDDQKENQPLWQIERDYYNELQAFYQRYGKNEMKEIVDNRGNITASEVFFDEKMTVSANGLYSYQDTLVQARFSAKRRINRLDIHWLNGVPQKAVRLEIQTSDNPDAWYSVVNDEPLWEFSTGRVGGTLEAEVLPGDKVTTLYFPERNTRAVRLLFTSFPNEVTELKFYGP